MSFFRQRAELLRYRENLAKAEADAVKKAGLDVSTVEDDPKHGVYEHKIAGRTVGHTVKAVANGTIAWTAVPANGTIKGGFRKHDEAKQYLADNHGVTLGKEDEEKARGLAAEKAKVKKSEEVLKAEGQACSAAASEASNAAYQSGGAPQVPIP